MRTVEITKEDFATLVKAYRVPAEYYEVLDWNNAYYSGDDGINACFKAGEFQVSFWSEEGEAGALVRHIDSEHNVKSVNALRAFLKAIIEAGQAEELTEEQDDNLFSLYMKCFR